MGVMSSCTPGRMVTLRFRPKYSQDRFHDRANTQVSLVVCPVKWTKSHLLKYCRREHPNQTVRILGWGPSYWPGDDRVLWIVDITAPL
jgi:hypothetical protein